MGTAILSAEDEQHPRRGSKEWYRQGPQKGWSEGEISQYMSWRERVYRKMYRGRPDDIVLRRQKAIINGNKITTEIWNYGSISSPGNKVTDIVWEGLGYGYEFGPFIVAEVEVPVGSHPDAYVKTDENGDPIITAEGDTVWAARIISDGLVSLGGETAPDLSEFWGWEPLAYNEVSKVPYADTESDRIPTSSDIDRDGDGKPDSWPFEWYNPNLKEYVWPGALRQGSSNADLEAFFVVDDRKNKEFEYYPFPDDSTRKGLGIEIECRYYQWSNPLAEDIIFLIYKVTNKSQRDLNQTIFGMWGDPHVGGPSNWQDDLSYFDRNLNMVYCWDEDGLSDVVGRKPGYFGYKFLESPGDPFDGVDNDGDGMIDESRSDGMDNDSDWDPEKDDIGLDGVPNTGDEGENDGLPTAGDQFDIRKPGEPHFEWTDLDESDMIGLTGFASPPYGGSNRISNDHYIFKNFLTPGIFDTTNLSQAGDYIFLYSSGPIDLPAGASRRFSIALIVGQDFDDLTYNAITAQDIYEKNYQFAKPPEKPRVTVVPGNERVTLYWDDVAESSYDPVSEENDFEGYVIYRSTDPQFLDQQTITDAFGSRFLFEPLKSITGASAKWDLVNEYSGLSTTPYGGRGVYYNLGNNTGLVHSFVDSNNVINGQTYYYGVVSYDHGSDALEIPPTESSKTITINPETNEILLDVNTAVVTPRAASAGYEAGHLENDWIEHTMGVATGDFRIQIIDPRSVEDENTFEIIFAETPLSYSVKDLKMVEESITIKLDKFASLSNRNIDSTSFVLKDSQGNSFSSGTDFTLHPESGRIKGLSGGSLKDGEVYTAQYFHSPILNSTFMNGEETNPVFDGMKMYVYADELALDEEATGWSSTSSSNWTGEVKPFNNLPSKMYPADYEIRFFDDLVTSSAQSGYEYIKANFEVWEVTEGVVPTKQRLVLLEVPATRDSVWSLGERAIIVQGEEGMNTTWEFTFHEPTEGAAVSPAAGDIFYIATSRAFTGEDVYAFTTIASKMNSERAASALEDIAVVPNPYVVTNALEPLDRQNPRDRGPRRLYFTNLPQECTIRIYTLTGEHLETLSHSSSIDDGQEFWDLTTRDNFPIAYGIYIYHVDAGTLGEKIGRFAVIK